MNIYNNSYLLTNEISQKLEKNISKFKKISIIYYNLEESNRRKYLSNCESLYQFCRKKNLPFFVTDNINLCLKYKCKGLLITNPKTRNNFTHIKNKLHIIGKAHNQFEYSLLINKGCKTIILSPLFYNDKYSENKILGPIKFNLITLNWKVKICGLGGINQKNIKKINLLKKVTSVSFKSFINNL
jgi:thiamine-phosphate pyrophosphorylase